MISEPATVKSEQSLIDGLQSVKLRPVHQLHLDPDYMEVDDVYGTKPSKKLSKLIMDEQKYVPEMVDTIKQKRQLIGTRRVTSIRGPPVTMDSSIAQVQQWLTLKGFSDYVKSVLSKCNGEHLFRITRKQLQQYCGEEANRLYSLITVQKKRANYSTGTEEQLKALLDMRKRYVDEHNDADSEPGDQISIAEQRPPSVIESVASVQPGSKVVPLDPKILMSQPIVVAPVKRPLQQTNNLPEATNGVHKPVVLPAKQPTSNFIAPKKSAIPDQVQIQVWPRARLSSTHAPAQQVQQFQPIQSTKIAIHSTQPSKITEIKPLEVKTAPEYLPQKKQKVQPTIVQVNPPVNADDNDSDDMNDSPRTQSLRQMGETVKRYY